MICAQANKGPPGGYKISSYEMQGKRKTMEDAKFELRSVAVGDVVGDSAQFKLRGAFVIASTSTPSTRRLLDGVATSIT